MQNQRLNIMIHITAAASHEITRLIHRQPAQDVKLRLGVKPGGCAEVYYTMEFDQVVDPSDRIYVCDTIQVVVDEKSYHYLEGLSIDYSEDLMGGGFRFSNPNASQSCGCGNSFYISQATASG